MMVKTPPLVQTNHLEQKAGAEGGATKLKATIPFSILLLLGINAIIGTGIFFVPGIAAELAGPGSLISWVAVGTLALVIAACFAELSSMFPTSGGVYEYTKQGFGEFAGFMVGWTGWIVANVTIAMLTIGAMDYLGAIVHLGTLERLVFAILFVLGMNYISYRGVDMSVKVLLVFAVCTLMSLWTLLTWGIYYVSIENLMPLSIFPKVSIVIAMLYILETFFGWETVTYMAEETKDPEKNIPKVMMWGTFSVVLLALGVVAVALGTVHWEVLANSATPLLEAAKVFMGPTGATFIAALVFLNILGGAAAWIVVTPRLVFALGRDKMLPDILSRIHPKYQTPHYAIGVQTILTIIILLSGSYKLLLEMVLPLAIFMYAMVIFTVTVLRFTKPDLKRPFKIPFGKVIPIIAGLILVFLAGGIEWHTTVSGFMFVAIGVPLFLIEAMLYRPKTIKKMLSLSVGISARTTDMWLSKKARKYIKKHLGNLSGKKVLSFGTDVSKFMVELSQMIGNGHLYVTHVSDKHLHETKKLAEKNGLNNISYYLEHEKRYIIHEHISNLDAIVSIGVLGYMQDPHLVIEELGRRVKRGGVIYFLDYLNVLKILPEEEWMKDANGIKAMFKKAGFNISVAKEKGHFWDTLHIYGHKV
jgi:basic amino acid/polyamine antiporter, APA family